MKLFLRLFHFFSIALVVVSPVVWANNASPVVTIDELLRLDTQAALMAARRSVVGSLERPGPAVVNDGETLLLAIYGVGKSLTAELLIDAEPHVFRATRALPVLGRSRTYTLDRIAPPCVHLHKAGSPEVVCLGMKRP
ncbi:MAG: hypothetical protein ACKO0Z_26140 [Betaproteobacteria bacterium]